MKDYKPKELTLKDGSKLTIRAMAESDLEGSLEFFRSFPEEDSLFFRSDMTKRENIVRRIELMKTGMVRRIVAVQADRIVGDGALEMGAHGCEEHMGEMRILVRNDFQRKGLGMIIARELYLLAAAEKLEKIVVRRMKNQETAKHILRKLGFREEIILPGLVRDASGKTQDLLVMVCDMEAMWKDLEEYFGRDDLEYHR